MSQDKYIYVDYVSRVEGQGTIDIVTSNGRLKKALFRIFEPPRFFEAFLAGRKYNEVHELAARICGICTSIHTITALRAVENAMGITISQQTRDLRKLLSLNQIIQSHALSMFILSAPDFLGFESIIPMVEKHPDLVKMGIQMKKLGNDITELVGGRAIHACTPILNGFSQIPSRAQMDTAKQQLKAAKKDALDAVEFFAKLETPGFVRKCEHVAISDSKEYAINEGRLNSTDGIDASEQEYRKHIKERQVPHSTAKHSWVEGRDSFLVGPLARVNLNFNQLSFDAREAAKQVGLTIPNFNPFMSHLARAIEIIHCIDESIEIIERVPLKDEDKSCKVKAGEGYAVTEAPRGCLYYYFKFNEEGIVEDADIVTPTAMNAYNIERDFEEFVPTLKYLPLEEATLKCEMLVRAYDPCISCSAHMLKVNIIQE